MNLAKEKKSFNHDVIQFIEFLTTKKYLLLSTIIILLMGYGFEIFNFTLSIDEEISILPKEHYNNYIWITQGRFGITLLKSIFYKWAFTPFLSTLLCILILGLSGLIWCYIFNSLNKNIGKLSLFSFLVMYLTYPIQAHFISFSTYNLEVSVGYLFLSIAIYLLNRYYIYNDKKLYLALGVVITTLSIAIYQSLVSVYLVGAFATCLLYIIDKNKRKIKLTNRNVFEMLIKYLVTLLGAIIAFFTILKLLQIRNPSSGYVEGFLKVESLNAYVKNIINNLANLILENRIYGGSVLAFSIIILAITTILLVLKNKENNNTALILISAGMLGSAFVMNILGGELPLRTYQGIPLLLGIIWLLLFANININTGKLVGGFIIILILMLHAQSLNELFYGDYIRYQADIAYGRKLADHIIELNKGKIPQKPIVVLGIHYQESPLIIKSDVIGASFFEWDGGNPLRIHAFLNIIGCNFISPTREQILDSRQYLKSMENWPKDNSILELDDRIIIKLSEPPDWIWYKWQ